MQASAREQPPAGSSSTGASSGLQRSDCDYAPFYCEENVYKLAERLEKEAKERQEQHHLFIIFISNRERMMEMCRQKIGQQPDGRVFWDYHVILLQCKLKGFTNLRDGMLVWDLDSTLPFPVDLDTYRSAALSPSTRAPCRRFRLVRYHDFIKRFASDRSHMLDPHTRQLREPSPPWRQIKAPGGMTMTLPVYLDMRLPSEDPEYPQEFTDYGVDRSDGFGVVFDEPNFWASLASFEEPAHL